VLLAAGFVLERAGFLDWRAGVELARAHADRWWLAPALTAVTALLYAATLPGSLMMVVVGVLLPPHTGAAVIVVGGTAGALGAHALARAAGGDPPATGAVARLLAILARQSGFPTLLALRIAPGFPHSAINVAAGLLNVPRGRFLLSTALGLALKGTLFVTAIHHASRAASVEEAISWRILVPLAALSLLLLFAPPLLRRFRARLAALALAALAAGLGAGCSVARSGEVAVATAGAVALETPASPADHLAIDGAPDELGWVLPLDVRRPRPPRPSAEQLPLPGASFGPPSPGETRLGPDDAHTENETAIAIDGTTIVAGWNGWSDGGLFMGVGRSEDGGESWSSSELAGFTTMSDPTIAAAGGGRWYYGYIARTGAGDFDVWVQRSIDDGESWLAPVAATANATFDDKPYLAGRGLEVLVAYADFSFSPAKVRAVRSLDGGESFQNDTVLIQTAGAGGNGACPVIAPDGTYYVFWRDSLQQFLRMARSTTSGATWEPEVPVVSMTPLPSSVPAPEGGYRLLNLPSAAVAPNGDLVVVWNDRRFGDADIVSVRSTDGGDTWEAPVRVNDDPPGALQFFPWVAIDDRGVVHVVWYDRRNDDVDLDVYYAESTDGGATFEPNRRITAASFTPVLPSEGGAAAFIGDYNGIAAGAAGVFPFYQDSRRGEQDVWVSRLPSPLFRDGFESGDSAGWSATEPES
jgi:uncharacterized membrane protein YdjX (TVP38/TMEM64 family)